MDNINPHPSNTPNTGASGKYTVPSQPPTKGTRQRRSRWTELFEECRAVPGEWRKVVEPMSKATAAQIASDIRNAHTRDLDKSRVKGFLPGDRWETVWGVDPADDEPGNFYVWLRYVGTIARAA